MAHTAHLHRIESMAVTLMSEFGLLAQGWEFGWSRSKSAFGTTKWVHATGQKIIVLSKPLAEVNTYEEMEDTMRHEIAHALAGAAAGHGVRWMIKCRETGARPERCKRAVSVTPLWVAYCPSCRVVVSKAHRKVSRVTACSRCCKEHNRGRFDARFTLVWTRNPALDNR